MSVHNIHAESMRDGDVYIGRAGKGQSGYFGNPFVLNAGETRGSTIERYEKYARERIKTDTEFRTNVRKLYGKRLFCFCKPHACHGDVLEKLALELFWEDAQPDYDWESEVE